MRPAAWLDDHSSVTTQPRPLRRRARSETSTFRPRIYLIRHGETDWNAEERLLSRTDMPLNTRGEAQARDLAATLAAVSWDRAITSPLIRARRTAQILLAGRPDAPDLTIDDRLVEMDFGPYEGWTSAELEADPVAVTRRRDGAQLPGVETEAEVASRARAFFADPILLTGTTLVVGHGRMLRILLTTCVLGVTAQIAEHLRMRNCRPAIVEPGRKPLLLGFNIGRPDDVGPAR